MADKCGFRYFETSCKEATNVDAVFETLAEDIKEQLEN
jgi:hypothetical protein